MQLHEVIRRLRRKREWSQQNLADEMNVHITTIQRYERKEGISSISYKDLEKLAQVFGLTLLELLSYEEEETDSLILEPALPYNLKKSNVVKVLVELNGDALTLEHWVKKLTSINQVI